MKLEVKVESATTPREHVLEFAGKPDASAGAGQWEFTLDGEPGMVDWAEVVPGVYSILFGGRSFEVRLRDPSGGPQRNGVYQVSIATADFRLEVRDHRTWARTTESHANGPHEIAAPMPGRIVKLLIEEGEKVEAGDGLFVIEAMKMQNELRAPRPGCIERIYVREGDGVESGAKLARLV
ncbi:MAG TPA: biotin/lipoyl-containing protein [Terriglobia bacterium]|nr:biotin/lipoyl-containing protein [Terriglobia bacterium]